MNRETVQWIVGTLILPALGAAFWAGHWAGNKEAQLQIAELRLAQSQLERNREQSERTISEQAKKIEQLSSEASACGFIKQQILDTTREIEVTRRSALVADEERPEQVNALQNQLAEYQKRLGTCNH